LGAAGRYFSFVLREKFVYNFITILAIKVTLMPSKEFVAEMKLKLLEAKSKLEEDLASLKSHEELGEDIDSSVQEVEGDDLSRGLIPRMKADLEKIGKALAKIEAGTYGTDDDGKEISEARLEALPWADKAI